MNNTELQEKLRVHRDSFEGLRQATVNDLNAYLQERNSVTDWNIDHELENLADNLVSLAGWIYDRKNGKTPKDRGSMYKRLRKAVGYSL